MMQRNNNSNNEVGLIDELVKVDYKADKLHILFSTSDTNKKYWHLQATDGDQNIGMTITTPALQKQLIHHLNAKDIIEFSKALLGRGYSAEAISSLVSDFIRDNKDKIPAAVTITDTSTPVALTVTPAPIIVPAAVITPTSVTLTTKDLYAAARKGNLETVKNIIDNGIKPDGGIVIAAIKSGNVELVKYLKEHHQLTPKSGIMEATDEAKSLEMVQYLMKEYPRFRYTLDNTITWAAARTGNLEFLKYFLELDIREVHADTGTLYDAVRADSLTIVKYLVKSCGITDVAEACDFAKRRGNESIFAYLNEQLELNKQAENEKQPHKNLDISFTREKKKNDQKPVHKEETHLMEDYSYDEDLELQEILMAQFQTVKPAINISQPVLIEAKEKSTFKLPDTVTVGTAVDDGGCFFDALAQGINHIQGKQKYSEKELRKVCHQYYQKHKEEVNEWNQKDYGGIDKDGEYGYSFIQYTQSELNESFNHRAPIWGRPHIEGVMICRELSLDAICVLEVIEDPGSKDMIPSFRRVTAEKDSGISEEKGYEIMNEGKVPTLAALQTKLHFVPIMRHAMSDEIGTTITTLVKSKSSPTLFGAISTNQPKDDTPQKNILSRSI